MRARHCTFLYCFSSRSLVHIAGQFVGEALATVGPSITMAAAAEVVAFALGGLSTMPAVRNFSICAALSVAIDFALQVCFNPLQGSKLGQNVRGQKRLAKRLQGCVSVTNA